MAEPQLSTLTPTQQMFGSFFLANAEYAIPVNQINDVINSPEKFTPQPLAPNYLLGIMSLRDMTIPVIDLHRMFDLESKPIDIGLRKIAVIEFMHQHIGLVFDNTGEVFSGDQADCDFTDFSHNDKQLGASVGAFRLGDNKRIIQWLDTNAIVYRDDHQIFLQKATNRDNESNHSQRLGQKHQSITFCVGGMELGLDIDQVQEVVQISHAENETLASEAMLGTTAIRGVSVPLFDLGTLLNIPPSTEQKLADQRIIIADSGSLKYAMVVDDICNIVSYYDHQLLDYPVLAGSNAQIFVGCIKAAADQEIIQIDAKQLAATHQVAASLENYQQLFEVNKPQTKRAKQIQARTVETFVTFRIDRLYALRILDILEIVDYPSDLLHPPLLDGHIDGILNLREHMISVISAKRLYDIESALEESAQIIIFEHNQQRRGLAISATDSIVHVRSDQQKKLPKAMLDNQSALAEDVREAIIFDTGIENEVQEIVILDIESIGQRMNQL